MTDALPVAGVLRSVDVRTSTEGTTMKPTIVLVHGAFAESSSWDAVVNTLLAKGYTTVAAASSLRALTSDAAAVSDLVRSVRGPVLLVGHAYGGAVITGVDRDAGEVRGLVYVCGFAPDAGDSCAALSALVPSSTPGARRVTQRPFTEAALNEPGGPDPLWKVVPSWFVFGELDRNIPVGVHRMMAGRAAARTTLEIPGAAHALPVSHPDEVTRTILEAARATGLVDA